MRVANVGGINRDATCRGGQNPPEALSDTPDCCSSIPLFPTAIADHVFGCQTAHPDYNHRMASAADGSPRPAPALDVRLLVDNMPMLAWSSHADGSVDFVNQQWRGYTGLSTEESHGPGWKAAVHPDDLPGLLQRWGTQPEVNHAGEYEVRWRRSDGVFRWFSLVRVSRRWVFAILGSSRSQCRSQQSRVKRGRCCSTCSWR